MLLPKLRIWFADFPWSHSPHRPEAIHLGVLMRIRYGLRAREEVDLWRSFHEDNQGTERYKNCIAFSMCSDAFHQLKCHSRRQRRQREKRTLHGPGYPSIRRCELLCSLKFPAHRCRNFGRLPFPPTPGIACPNHRSSQDRFHRPFQGGLPRG
jgi:hypothetical protein